MVDWLLDVVLQIQIASLVFLDVQTSIEVAMDFARSFKRVVFIKTVLFYLLILELLRFY